MPIRLIDKKQFLRCCILGGFLWSAVAERSGDTAFGWHERNKAVCPDWYRDSHRTPN